MTLIMLTHMIICMLICTLVHIMDVRTTLQNFVMIEYIIWVEIIRQNIDAKGLSEGILLDRNEWRKLIHGPDPA